MDEEYQKIVLSNVPNYHFDSEIWNKDVEKNQYEIITKDGFAILINFKKRSIFKTGYSRGGIRFDHNSKTLEEYREFLEYLKVELKNKKYTFVGIDPVEEVNQFNSLLDKQNFRAHPEGTALIYPKKEWITKFNSKKRYDLTYASKKGVEVKLFTNNNWLGDINHDELELEKFFTLVKESLQRNKNAYSLPSNDEMKKIFENMNFILPIAIAEDKYISFNLSLFNPSGNLVERLYAGTNDEGTRLRAPSLIEVRMVDYLTDLGIQTYDLWIIKKGMGATEFKKSIADEIKEYAPYSIVNIQPFLSFVYTKLVKTFIALKHKLH